MRIRTIKPEFWINEKLSNLPECVHMFAAALLNYADDEGFFNANPVLIKCALFPLREPSVSIHGALSELSRIGYIRVAKAADGREYGWIINFAKHQRINRPSRSKIKDLADFTEPSVRAHGVISEGSLREQGTGNREQGTGNREQGLTRKRVENVDFDLFWDKYPRKVGKANARKSFQKAKKAGMPKIEDLIRILAIQTNSDQWSRDGGQYIPHPTTWLNRGGWDDVLGDGREDDLSLWASRTEERIGNDARCNSEVFQNNFRELPGKIPSED